MVLLEPIVREDTDDEGQEADEEVVLAEQGQRQNESAARGRPRESANPGLDVDPADHQDDADDQVDQQRGRLAQLAVEVAAPDRRNGLADDLEAGFRAERRLMNSAPEWNVPPRMTILPAYSGRGPQSGCRDSASSVDADSDRIRDEKLMMISVSPPSSAARHESCVVR